jgi:hypothetical protein
MSKHCVRLFMSSIVCFSFVITLITAAHASLGCKLFYEERSLGQGTYDPKTDDPCTYSERYCLMLCDTGACSGCCREVCWAAEDLYEGTWTCKYGDWSTPDMPCPLGGFRYRQNIIRGYGPHEAAICSQPVCANGCPSQAFTDWLNQLVNSFNATGAVGTSVISGHTWVCNCSAGTCT